MTEERTQYTTQPDELTQLRQQNRELSEKLDRQIAAWNGNGDALTAHAARQAARIAELEATVARLETDNRRLRHLDAMPVDAMRVVVKDVPASGYHTGNPMNTAVTDVRTWLATLDGDA